VNNEQLAQHVDALVARHAADVAAVVSAAESARGALQGGASELHTLAAPNGNGSVPTLGGLPVDELPPYVPPPDAHAENALIPDTPLVDGAAGAPAFDDAPLWQN
jgi:hypothetical protein